MQVETDILKYANDIKMVGVGEETATTYMLLLLVVMNNKRGHTKVIHVQDASLATQMLRVSYNILWEIQDSFFV